MSETYPQWQPIETAPKNAPILVFIPDAEHYGPGVYRGMLVDNGKRAHWSTNAMNCGGDCGHRTPTHWMPLPPPPEAK